jgi:hypothetical protein
MSAQGQKRSSLLRKPTSGLPSTTDITRQIDHFRKVRSAEGKADALNNKRHSSIDFGGFATSIATTCGRPSLYAPTSKTNVKLPEANN